MYTDYLFLRSETTICLTIDLTTLSTGK